MGQDPVGGRGIDGRFAGQFAETGVKTAEFIQRRHRRQAFALAEMKILLAAAGGNVNDARAFRLADVLPGDDAMHDALRDRQLVERAAVRQVDEVGALHFADHVEAGLQRNLRGALRDVEHVVPVAHLQVRQLRMHRRRDVPR